MDSRADDPEILSAHAWLDGSEGVRTPSIT